MCDTLPTTNAVVCWPRGRVGVSSSYLREAPVNYCVRLKSGSLASETSKQEDDVVETKPLKVPDGKALDESNIKDNREISDILETFKHESFNNII